MSNDGGPLADPDKAWDLDAISAERLGVYEHT
jgi:hypothetical protein